MTSKVLTSRELGKAICDHLGIDTKKHSSVQADYVIKTDEGDLAKVTLTVLLGADDLAGIAKHAAEAEQFDHVKSQVSSGTFCRDVMAALPAEASDTLRRYGVGERNARAAQGFDDFRVPPGPSPVRVTPVGGGPGNGLGEKQESKLDQIISLLKQVVENQTTGVMNVVQVTPWE